MPDPGNRRSSQARRGDVKFLLGDLHGAIADYTESGGSSYNRGFAYEKLGKIEKAIADYTEVIERLESPDVPAWARHVNSSLPREGYGNRISLDELKEIRDRLVGTPR